MRDSKRIVVIQGHPDPSPTRFCHGLAQAYAAGAIAAGHAVDIVTLATLDIPLLRTKEEFESGELPASLHKARDAIIGAQHIVLIFPLWLGTMPALVKMFLEQIMRPGVAFRYRERGMPERLLRGRSAHIVVTMGMPAFLYRWYFFSHGIHGLRRGILGFAGIRPVRTTLVGSVESDRAYRERWLARMAAAGANAA